MSLKNNSYGEQIDEEPTFLGLDLSTQQLKAVVIDNNLNVLQEENVQFDTDLPEFSCDLLANLLVIEEASLTGGYNLKALASQPIKSLEQVVAGLTPLTTSGAIVRAGSHVVTAPVMMWIKALDMILDRLKVAGVNFETVASLSGTAQQHGSVYWNKGSQHLLQNLRPERFLHDQLRGAFALAESPIWQDSSTSKQCNQLEAAVGGPEKLAKITGSRAYERFTASQIAKIYQTKTAAYNNTERISLVSSFVCSLFLGDYATIDFADGSGMNLMDLHTKKWSHEILEAVAPDLEEKLGDLVPSYADLGPISNYYVERFGFNPSCRIVAFTGDNPASLIGMNLKEGDVAVSLGTSDTVFLSLAHPKTILEGHVLCNPLNKDSFMALLCFKNGSLTRERIRDNCAEGSWNLFNELLNSTPRGNFGNMGLYFDAQEIIPSVRGDYRINKGDIFINKFPGLEIEVRALIEGQFIAKRAHAEDLGFSVGKETRIIATGGASKNLAILQVLSDVFNAPVYTLKQANSAVLGAAYQAKHALVRDKMTFDEMTKALPPPELACTPSRDANEIYTPMIKRYRNVIQRIVRGR